MERTETFKKDFRKFRCAVSDELPFSISPQKSKESPTNSHRVGLGWGESAEVLTQEVFNQVQVKSQPSLTTLQTGGGRETLSPCLREEKRLT